MSTLSNGSLRNKSRLVLCDNLIENRLQPQGFRKRRSLGSQITFSFTVFQFDWKKQAENPSGPGAFPG
ncbi:unnamed protein product [Microthlaspi erraticum]|uniref:Uncharacterized protein n=1 Tax=Microthlaspi erraticum TaxID=1685480 RepID=A0A6D2I4C5_9BRAS|nr:unnamed protein product [Microthlaspi erraticum]